MKNVGIVLISLIVVGLFCLSLYQHQTLKKLTSAESPGKAAGSLTADNTQDTEDETIAAKQPPVAAINSGDIDVLVAELDATENELDSAYGQLDDEMARKEALKQKELELQRQYLESPAFRNSIRTMVDTRFKDLLDEMNLSEEDRQKFADIYADYYESMNLLQPEISSAVTDDQKDDLRQRYADAGQSLDAQMEALLGSEYDTYQAYTEMATTRNVINNFKAALDSESQLTGAQEKALTEIMYKEQSRVFSEMGYDPRHEIEFPSDVEEGAVSGQLKNMEKIHLASIENAQGVLSETQVQQLQAYLENQREMMALSLKLSN